MIINAKKNTKQKDELIKKNNRHILTLNNIYNVKTEENENFNKNKKVKKLIFKKKSEKNPINHEMRIITIPLKRQLAVKKNWLRLINPIVKYLKLEIRLNNDKIEVRTCNLTEDKNNLQKCADYIKAFLIGYSLEDSCALLKIEDLFIETFQIQDVKTLKGDHLSRCIGRICGTNGSTKYAIENATKTRIIISDDKINILGSINNIKMARYLICSLILGKKQSKVLSKLNMIAGRLKERF